MSRQLHASSNQGKPKLMKSTHTHTHSRIHIINKNQDLNSQNEIRTRSVSGVEDWQIIASWGPDFSSERFGGSFGAFGDSFSCRRGRFCPFVNVTSFVKEASTGSSLFAETAMTSSM